MRGGLARTVPLITSRDNTVFKSLKKLAQNGRERKKTGLALLDGEHLIAGFVERIGQPQLLVVSPAGLQRVEIRTLQEALPSVPLTLMSDALFREIAPVETPTGILARVAIPRLPLAEKIQFAVFLETLQDPGNLGSILRSAAAAGAQAAYLSAGCADAWSPRVLRGGMGAHFHLPIREGVNLVEIAENFVGDVVVTSLQAEVDLFELDLGGPVAFVIGNEGAGVSPSLQQAATQRVRIPMPGAMESLNAAAAAAICFFERVRQVSKVTGPRKS
ncbi:MAG: RNA methyltransferase [Sulfurimicrobium sp.]|nr:RNA methyltransferase [Sulfurimicrobium sp.]